MRNEEKAIVYRSTIGERREKCFRGRLISHRFPDNLFSEFSLLVGFLVPCYLKNILT